MAVPHVLLLALLSTVHNPVLCEPEPSDGGLDVMADVLLDLLHLVDVNLDVDLDLLGGGGGCGDDHSGCYSVDTCSRNLDDNYCEQPLFAKFLTKTEKNCLIDNVCYTYFPLPDDPYTYNQYRSTVFVDGSFVIETSVITDIELGRQRAADPCCTSVYNYIGYVGCDTFVAYRCLEYGDCTETNEISVIGLSPSLIPLGLACAATAREVISCSGLPDVDIVVLPQALPPKCVTEQMCLNPIQGNYFRALELPFPAAPTVLI